MTVAADPGVGARRFAPGRVLEATGGIAASFVAIYELGGAVSQGLRFLGQFSRYPGLVIGLVAGWTILVCAGAVLAWHRISARARRTTPGSAARSTWVARGAIVAALALTMTASLVLCLSILRYDVVHAEPVQTGQLGVAVADIGEGTDLKSSNRGREIAAYIARSLRRELSRVPELAGSVTIVSAPLVADEAQARAAAARLGVRLMIWGWVSAPPSDVISPEFTFIEGDASGTGLPDIPEWHTVEVGASGSLELGRIVAGRSSGLVAYVLGLIHLSQQDFPAAAAGFREAISLAEAAAVASPVATGEEKSLNRTLAIYHMALGRSLAANAEPEAARAEYEAAVGHDPDYGPSYIGLGNIEYSLDRCAEAETFYRKAATYTAVMGRAWYSIGNACYCQDKLDTAAKAYANAIATSPHGDKGLATYHLTLGVTLCRLGRPTEGLAELQTARELAGSDSDLARGAIAEADNCQEAAATTPSTGATRAGNATPTPAGSRTLTAKGSPATGSPSPSPSRSSSRTATPSATPFGTAHPVPLPTNVSGGQPASTNTLQPASTVRANPTPTATRTVSRTPTSRPPTKTASAKPTDTPKPPATWTPRPPTATQHPPWTPTRTRFPTVAAASPTP